LGLYVFKLHNFYKEFIIHFCMGNSEAEIKKIRELEARMSESLFEGLGKNTIYGEAVNAVMELAYLSNTYSWAEEEDEAKKGLEKALIRLEEGDPKTWEKCADAVSASHDLFPSDDLEKLDKFKKVLELAPEGVDVSTYLTEIEKNRKSIKKKEKSL